MRLESALYASRSGLESNGHALGVIGDNVSNSNTIAYKRSRVEFADIYADGVTGAQSTAGPQTGSGVRVSEIRQHLEVGVIEDTSRGLDAAIEGRGHFIVGSETNPRYTRAGNFEIRSDGILTTATGEPVLGFVGDSQILTDINMLEFDQQTVEATSNVSLFGNLNVADGASTIPDAPQRFSEINNAAAYTVVQEVYDSLGDRHPVTLAFYREAATNSWTTVAYMDAGELGGEDSIPQEVGRSTITFSSNGRILEENATSSVDVTAPYSNGSDAGQFAIDLSGFSQFAGASGLTATTIDGRAAGDIQGYEITAEGTIYAVFSNGDRGTAGILGLASFVNDEGLARAGNNYYLETIYSGERTVGQGGSGSLGTIAGNSLERSTVDIATEFVDLTLFQRAYQANSQTLNATSQLLRETIQLIR
jgi:flagellar hook protein FlgE